MKFSQLDLTRSYPITAEQAWNLANAYWDGQDGCEDGAAGTIFTTRVVLVDAPSSDADYYRVVLQEEWSSNGGREGHECMSPYDVQLKDQILVNAFTGEITESTYESSVKDISIEQAKEIASHHWGWRDGEGTGACGTTIIPVFVVSEVPTENSDCYRIILRLEYYSHAVEGWENSAPYQISYEAVAIDAYTGECVDEELIAD